MKICSRDYKLSFDNKTGRYAGEFYSSGSKGAGNGEIKVHCGDLRTTAEILCHEIMEAILCEDGKRYCSTSYDYDNSRYLFQFSHDYLDGYGAKLLDALITSGMFKLVDCRPKKVKRKAKSNVPVG